ncbi:NAD(P)H-hydrate dehydratase [Paenibacillus xerothermodurans]|uniref:Bifunctional NAD(P)H-hydrate repair enzyme n=1 Tax=Paenibacillus xerothermodurans TaxID=1977292 RepID=A0A2W1NSI4_PAEXE|nr:NAD(P)H-hydrate dehydratase [Paenibacillus xerothermodurans]PZE21743.1 NAD(P)H-hydrate dehydratase [Paenibacillus xerothermodurans]
MYVVTSKEMREMDRYTIEQIGIPALVLMENAGRAVAEEVLSYNQPALQRVAILLGKGNNGADGIVTARHLLDAGREVRLIYAVDPADLAGDAAVQRAIAEKLNIPFDIYDSDSMMHWDDFDGIIDALLGTGSRGTPRDNIASLIRAANASGLPIFAIDVPSGLNADTGAVHDPCVHATITVALGFTKRGIEQQPGAAYAGQVVVRFIGIPRDTAARVGVSTFRTNERLLTDKLHVDRHWARNANAHKGSYGHVLVAAGSRPMGGAGLLCAMAALRAGSGLVTWALPDKLLDPMLGRLPEAMLRGLPDGGLGDWREVRAEHLTELAAGKSAMVFGPGVGRWENDSHWLRKVWETTTCPLVLDADALNMISSAQDFGRWPARTAPVILTPHPGEMGRLAGKETAEVQRDRIDIARQYAERHNVTLVLKGARTVVATPEGEVFINPTGNPGMATGGTGDVLAGMTAGLLAQGMSSAQAAVLGVYLHGDAGDRAAAARRSAASLVASDILNYL